MCTTSSHAARSPPCHARLSASVPSLMSTTFSHAARSRGLAMAPLIGSWSPFALATAGRDLVQQRLEQMIVVTVDQGYSRPLVAQPRRARHAAEASANEDNMWCAVIGWGCASRPTDD